MQPTESFSVTRRALDVEDYIDIVRRHKSWIFGPFLFCVVASVVGVYLWPDSYISEGKVRITPQQVPESMVMSTFNQKMWDRIVSMRETILSTSELTNIINNKGLYRRELGRMTTQDVVEKMRKDITIVPLGGTVSSEQLIPAFAITFSYDDRVKAQQVVADLMTRFIDENLKNNNMASFATVGYFKDQADAAKKELDEIENKITEFQVQNNGRLPDQMDANYRSLMTLDNSLSSLNAQLGRSQAERLQIQAQITSLQNAQRELTRIARDTPAVTPNSVQRNERLLAAEKEVQYWEDQLRSLRQRFNEAYPDIQIAIGQLNAAKQKRDELQKEELQKEDEARKAEAKKDAAAAKGDKSDPVKTSPALSMNLVELDGRLRGLQTQLTSTDLQIEQIHKDIKHVNDEMKNYQGRIESAPLGQKTYADLLRDKEMARMKYADLSERLDKAQRSATLESRNEGQRLESLDPASLPTDPTEPKRPLVIAIGSAIGLLLGIVIAGAREMKDTSLKNLKDVRAYTQMSVLGSIPLLENDFVVRRRRRLAWLGWTTACLVAVVVMVGAVVYYYSAKGGIQ